MIKNDKYYVIICNFVHKKNMQSTKKIKKEK